MERKRKPFDLEHLSRAVVHVFCTIIFFFLTLSAWLFTRYFPKDYQGEVPHNRFDLLSLIGAVLIGIVILILGNWIMREREKEEYHLRLLLGVVMGWSLLFGIVWVLLARSVPVADQMKVASSAQRFLEGNYGRLGYGKYLYYYPFQLGLTAWEELVFAIFGSDNFTAFQILNAVAITGSIGVGYKIVRLLFQERKTAAYYLLLSGICFPFFIYSAYVYGDVMSIFLSLFGIWQFLRYIKCGKWSAVLLLTMGIAGAVLLRNNSLIVLIAIGAVLVVQGIGKKHWRYGLCLIIVLAGVFGSKQVLNRHYEQISGITLNDGMPSVLWIAMGMQEGDKEAGWYNGYSVYTYQDVCLYHGPTAAALGRAEIRSRAKEFLFHPVYALDFYWRKFTSQWNDPTYGSFIMTYATAEPDEEGNIKGKQRGTVGDRLYAGGINTCLRGFMDGYQLLIYGAVLCLLIRKRRDREPLEFYILLISILGGVLFHMLWEAKSRYVLPYFVMMLPMAAGGLYQINEVIRGWGTKDEA